MIAEILSNYITHFISSIGYLGVFILMVLESAALPVPSEVVMPFAGYLTYLGSFNLFLISIIGAAGNMAGSIISYWVGLKGGRPFLIKYGKYLLINFDHIELTDRWFNMYGDKAIFLSRLIPVVRTFISFPAGIGRYNINKLALYSFFGSLPWCFGLSYIGLVLGPYWKNIIQFFDKLDIIVIIITILFVLYFWKIKKLR